MPDRAPRFCPYCRKAYTGQRCPCRAEAQQQYDRDRGPDRQFYSKPRWRQFRKRFLAANPWCVFCLKDDGRQPTSLTPPSELHRGRAMVVDHIIPREERPDLAYTASNCRGLCVSCHNRRTRKQEQGVSDANK